jgi:hypothetical protein
MSELFWCMDCRIAGALDVHGRCSRCGSDAVVISESVGTEYGWLKWAEAEVESAVRMKKAHAHEDFRKLYDEGEIR